MSAPSPRSLAWAELRLAICEVNVLVAVATNLIMAVLVLFVKFRVIQE